MLNKIGEMRCKIIKCKIGSFIWKQMKISNNKNVPLLNKNPQNNNNLINTLSPRTQKNNLQTLNQNIQNSQVPSNDFLKQGL